MTARATGAGRRGFALLSPAFLDELRARVTLSTLVGRTVPLKRAGNEYKACCPFHQEKTPSFWVNDQKGFYHCFGCSAHGDAIRWLTEARGLAFMEAVKQLADETGMELPKPEPEEVARLERAAGQQEIMETAARYFETKLSQSTGSTARTYLQQRDVSERSIADFRIGYAPEGRSNLSQALSGFTQQQLIDAGLLISVEDKEPYDRFRNRIMVPIKDPKGRVIAFGGRILGPGEPKYLNSPDTFLFDKGRVLFNFDRAAPASRQSGRIIVAEGYFDVIALDDAGFRETVAPMGTALTDAQLEQLWRLVDDPILCFDGDSAGRKAAERTSLRAMPSLRPGKQLRIVILPAGQDPDDFVRTRGKVAFEQAIENALPLATFLYRAELGKINSARPEQRANLRKTLEDLARSSPDRFVADEFSRSFSDLFFEDFGWKAKQRGQIWKSTVQTSVRVAPDLYRLYVRSALYGMTRFPAVAAANLEEVAAIPIAHPALNRWRDAIGEAVLTTPDLTHDGLAEVLETKVLPETHIWDIRHDLRFGFARKGTAEAAAVKQLEALIEFLAQEKALSDQMKEYDKVASAAAAATDANAYDAVELARQRVREARIAMLDRGANWDGQL